MSNEPLTRHEAERLRAIGLTYAEVGATRSDTVPEGYEHLRRVTHIGAGAERFDSASRAVLAWEMHRRAGLRVRASEEHAREGTVAVVRIGLGPLGLNAPVRVIYVVDEPARRGFAYGTLPGHPESGEEAFVVDMDDGGTVSLTITAFSRPDTRLARLGGPLARVAQSWVIDRYARSV